MLHELSVKVKLFGSNSIFHLTVTQLGMQRVQSPRISELSKHLYYRIQFFDRIWYTCKNLREWNENITLYATRNRQVQAMILYRDISLAYVYSAPRV